MRILLTGATGYFGTNLVSALAVNGHQLFAFVRKESNTNRIREHASCHLVVPDFNNLLEIVLNIDPEITTHYASIRGHGPEMIKGIAGTNIEFGVTLLEAFAASKCRKFIKAGSYWQYAKDDTEKPNT
jgi:nucleoside-diphosphate-sugar epimerase